MALAMNVMIVPIYQILTVTAFPMKMIPVQVTSSLGDFDRDGFCGDMDCDDNDRKTYPGAPELAWDEKDNNCNDQIDELEVIEFQDSNFKKCICNTLDLGNTIECSLNLSNINVTNQNMAQFPFNLGGGFFTMEFLIRP